MNENIPGEIPQDVLDAAKRLAEHFPTPGQRLFAEELINDMLAGDVAVVDPDGGVVPMTVEGAPGIGDPDYDEIDEYLDELEEQDADERELRAMEAPALGTEDTEEPGPGCGPLVVRSVVTQPPLPKIFRLIIENQNRRWDIRAKGSDMTQEDWRELKALNLDMKKSLRPGAERALSRAAAP